MASYTDLRSFLRYLESEGEVKRIQIPINPKLEITEICNRTLQKGGPALLFENPVGSEVPVLGNLFGTKKRITMAIQKKNVTDLRDLGKLFSELKHPSPIQNLSEAWGKLPLLKELFSMSPNITKSAACQEIVLTDKQVDLSTLPIQTCWPGDIGPLITWGLSVTKGPNQARQNLGVYRLQVLNKNQLIIRWLRNRGGALDFQAWKKQNPGKRFPIAVIIGADPATLLSAVMPVPDSVSEYSVAGLLRGSRTELVKCRLHDLQVPAAAEYIIEGYIEPDETAIEGPFADHTGYYNAQESFPVFTVECITHRKKPIYHSTYTGRPPDEPSMLGYALNDVFIPILQKQFPEIQDCYLPPEACSYRMAVITIKKQYAGHAKQIMFGVWSYLKQFTFTKFIIVTDDDIDARDFKSVLWAISTRMDPARDTIIIENTPIDYLDFASPVSGLGSKIGFDATNKWPGETTREWGEPVNMDEATKTRVDSLWKDLCL